MELYLITRNDYWSYDDYDATVVAASSEAQARELALAQFCKGETPSKDESLTAVLLASNALVLQGVVLSSFNAG